MIIQYSDNILIGDFINTLPAVIALKQKYNADKVYLKFPCRIPQYKYEILDMIPKKHNIKFVTSNQTDPITCYFKFQTSELWSSQNKDIGEMSRAHFYTLGLDIPDIPPRLELELNPKYDTNIIADFGLAPFSSSRKSNELWPKRKWKRLVNYFSDKTFVLFGAENDDSNFITGPNVIPLFGHPLQEVAWTMKKIKLLIAVNSAPQHLSYCLNIPTLLFSNHPYGRWGINYDAIEIKTTNVANVSVETVINEIQRFL